MKKYNVYQQLYFLLFLLIFNASCNGQSQTIKLSDNKTELKLKGKATAYGPLDIVQCMIQDKAGNLWFGGRYGRLFRYDGKTFTDFSKNVHKE